MRSVVAVGAAGYREVHCLERLHQTTGRREAPEGEEEGRRPRLRLERGENAVGRVLDPTGKPLTGVYVAAVAYGYAGQKSTHDWIPTRTDANGSFRIPGLRPGLTHVITLRYGGWASVVYYLPKAADGPHRLDDVKMRRPRVVRGRVLGSQALPVDRIKVGLWGQTRTGSTSLRVVSTSKPDRRGRP